jgi:hypothetical protein
VHPPVNVLCCQCWATPFATAAALSCHHPNAAVIGPAPENPWFCACSYPDVPLDPFCGPGPIQVVTRPVPELLLIGDLPSGRAVDRWHTSLEMGLIGYFGVVPLG